MEFPFEIVPFRGHVNLGGNKLYIYAQFVNCETLAAPIGMLFLEARA